MAKPLLDVYYEEKPLCKYPVQLRIAMDDGTVQTYNLEVKQPIENPSFREAMDALGRMFERIEIGYQYGKEPSRKRKSRRSH